MFNSSKLKGAMRFFYTLLFIVIMVSTIFSQTYEDPMYPKIVPPPPDAASLGKYGQFPVSLHTGVPNITIPIFELPGKELSVPVSMSYHASGILVDDLASWVGLGWSLNAGGMITRTVRGRPDDETTYGFYNRTPVHSDDISSDAASWQLLKNISDGDYDVESDYYFYNFQGKSGKFIFDDDKEILKIPFDPIVIDKSNYPMDFKIIDENGTYYKFDACENAKSGSYISSVWDEDFSYTSTWYLTQIISSDKSDTIKLSYTTDTEIEVTSENHSQTLGDKWELSGGLTKSSNVLDTDNASQSVRRMSIKRLDKIESKKGYIKFIKASANRKDLPRSRLESIYIYSDTTGNKTYKLKKKFILKNNKYFSYNNGGTISGNVKAHHRLKLDSLEECSPDANVKKIHQFFYYEDHLLPPTNVNKGQDLWGYNNGHYTNSTTEFTLIPEMDTVTYNGSQFTVGAANREIRESYAKACILDKIVFPTGGYTEFAYESNKYNELTETDTTVTATAAVFEDSTSLHADTVYITPATTGWATLKTTCSDVKEATPYFSRVSFKIKNASTKIVDHVYDPYNYPDFDPMYIEEYSVYLIAGTEYEIIVSAQGASNSQSYGGAAFSIGALTWGEKTEGSNKSAGGLRIKEIKSYTSSSADPIIKTFKYGEGESGYGDLLVPNDFASMFFDVRKFVLGVDGMGGGCVYWDTDRITYYGNTINSLSTINGSPVVYGTVTEYIGTPSKNNGKIIHKFDIAMDDIQGVDKAYKNGRYQSNASWKGGNEIQTRYYKDDTTTVIGKNEHGYITVLDNEHEGFIAGWESLHSGCMIEAGDEVSSDFFWFDYEIRNGVKRPSSDKKIVISSDTSKLETEVLSRYYYDNQEHWLMSRSISYNSNGDTVETRYNYPQDYAATVGNLNTLVDNNIIGIPVKTEKVVNGKLVEGTVIKQNNYGKPIEVYKYESEILQNAPSFDTTQLIPSSYQKRITFEYNSTTKNLENVLKVDDTPQTYIWGYNGTVPVAKIENAEHSDVETVLGSGYRNGLVSLSTSQNNSLRTHNQLSDALVTSYTYDPLIGIASVIDPSGLDTHYDYDDFMRLETIKDDDEYLVKGYEYNYASTPQLFVSNDSIGFEGGSDSETVSISSNVSWTVSDNKTWITTDLSSGFGNSELEISVTANTNTSDRSGIVTISENDGYGLSDREITVTQEGITPSLTVSETELLFGGSHTETFTITSNTSWTIYVTYYDDNGWLSISPTYGTGNATIYVTSSSAMANNWEAELDITGGGIHRYIDVVKYY
jgi:hypothetical protein